MRMASAIASLVSMRIDVSDAGDMLSDGRIIGHISNEGITYSGTTYHFPDIASITADIIGSKQGFAYIPRLLNAAGDTIVAMMPSRAPNTACTGITAARAYLNTLPHGTAVYRYPDVIKGTPNGIERADVVKEIRTLVQQGIMSLAGDTLCWSETNEGIPARKAIEQALSLRPLSITSISDSIGIALQSVNDVMFRMASDGVIAHTEYGWELKQQEVRA